MGTVRQAVIGVVSLVLFVGGVTLVTPVGSEAQAAPPAGPFADQNAEMTAQHDGFTIEIGTQHTTTQGVIGTAQTAIQGTVQTESGIVQGGRGSGERTDDAARHDSNRH